VGMTRAAHGIAIAGRSRAGRRPPRGWNPEPRSNDGGVVAGAGRSVVDCPRRSRGGPRPSGSRPSTGGGGS